MCEYGSHGRPDRVEMEALTAVTVALPDRDRYDQVPGSGRHHRSGAGRFPRPAGRVGTGTDEGSGHRLFGFGVRGPKEDTTGPVLAAGLRDLGCEVADVLLVPDDVAAITAVIRAHAADLVLCTGGTGLGPPDVTPMPSCR